MSGPPDISVDEFPKCEICDARMVRYDLARAVDEEKGIADTGEAIYFACGRKVHRSVEWKFPDGKNNFPNGRFATFRTGPWDVATKCGNAEIIIQRMREVNKP